jgi:hypothetical protein
MNWLGTVLGRTDHDITDDAAGHARLHLAASSRARKRDEARQLASENAAARARNASTAVRTNADINSGEAGQRRIALAAASKAQRDEMTRRLAAENAAERRQRATTASESHRMRTDTYIEDDDAGRRRIQLAAENKARREMTARRLAAENAAARRRTAATEAWVDDEVGGTQRKEMSAQSKARRAAEARMLAQRNADMRRRLKGVKARTENTKGKGGGIPNSPEQVAARQAEEAAVARAKQNVDDESAEIELLREMIFRKQVSQRGTEPGWDNKKYQPVPYALRGLRPMYTIEPWSKDVVVKHARPSSTYATAGLSRLDDGMADDIVSMRRRKLVEEQEASTTTGRPRWDNTTWRYTPPALRGIKPVTPEPWLQDWEAYERAGS